MKITAIVIAIMSGLGQTADINVNLNDEWFVKVSEDYKIDNKWTLT